MSTVARRARGFALILALFLIVSLAAIGGYLLTVSNVQSESGVLDEQGARAYQAARAGLEWGAYRVLIVGSCNAGPVNLAMPFAVGGFHASVRCVGPLSEIEGGATVNVYLVTSTGCNATECPGAGAPGYVERELQLTLAN